MKYLNTDEHLKKAHSYKTLRGAHKAFDKLREESDGLEFICMTIPIERTPGEIRYTNVAILTERNVDLIHVLVYKGFYCVSA